ERATLEDVNTSWAKYQIVIANDAAGSGISYDLPGRGVYVYATSCGPTTQFTNVVQGVGRVRRPKFIASWIDERTYEHETNREALRASMLAHAERDVAMI